MHGLISLTHEDHAYVQRHHGLIHHHMNERLVSITSEHHGNFA